MLFEARIQEMRDDRVVKAHTRPEPQFCRALRTTCQRGTLSRQQNFATLPPSLVLGLLQQSGIIPTAMGSTSVFLSILFRPTAPPTISCPRTAAAQQGRGSTPPEGGRHATVRVLKATQRTSLDLTRCPGSLWTALVPCAARDPNALLPGSVDAPDLVRFYPHSQPKPPKKSSIFVCKMCVFVHVQWTMSLIPEKNCKTPNRLLIFLWKKTRSRKKHGNRR